MSSVGGFSFFHSSIFDSVILFDSEKKAMDALSEYFRYKEKEKLEKLEKKKISNLKWKQIKVLDKTEYKGEQK